MRDWAKCCFVFLTTIVRISTPGIPDKDDTSRHRTGCHANRRVLSAMLWSHVGLRPYGRVGEDAIFTGRQDDQKTFVEVG